MKVRAFVFSVFLLASVSLFSQENETKETLRYSNITEFGFFTTSPRSVGFESTTVNGFSINQQHCLGMGLGFGYILGISDDYFFFHMPMFINYRLYFKPEKSFSPHLNAAIGGTMITDGGGIYSAVTVGFRAGKFSFSSGISFMAIEEKVNESISIYGDYGWIGYETKTVKKWFYPLGISLKCGFSF